MTAISPLTSRPSAPAPAEVAPRPTAPPAGAPVVVAPLEPSPSLRLDPALNLVVLEFRDDSGAVVNSIPNARQLAAYRAGEAPKQALGD